jgi:hypothetical protein
MRSYNILLSSLTLSPCKEKPIKCDAITKLLCATCVTIPASLPELLTSYFGVDQSQMTSVKKNLKSCLVNNCNSGCPNPVIIPFCDR